MALFDYLLFAKLWDSYRQKIRPHKAKIMCADQTIKISNEADMQNFAQECANQCHQNHMIALYGTLGAGKTTFARHFIRTLTYKDMDVPSPTFTLVQEYDTSKGLLRHFDLYRLENKEEIYEIGWEDAIVTGINLIEWPERLGTLLPKKRTDISIEIVSDNEREITVHHHGTE